ncbi:hypothetical protein HHX47_DHR4000672 [Lentinula edodes]|nr:hypothetical protein HHX47_DHR4000672 [Lentinula edodes]
MSITDLTVKIPSSSRSTSIPSESNRKPSRWGTVEFKFYYVILCLALPFMIWIPITLSDRMCYLASSKLHCTEIPALVCPLLASHPNYPQYQYKLWQGWLFGRNLDNSDSQYRSFRNNIPILTGVAFLFLLLKYFWNKLYLMSKVPGDNLHLIPLNAALSLIFLVALHGSSILKLIVVITINFIIAKACKSSKLGPVLTWAFNIGILFMNDRYNGYRFGAITPSLEFLDEEKYEGFYPRWHINFNITMLRLVSFSMDYYWACRKPNSVEYSSTSWYRHVCALGGVVNILLMITANLVGFVIGVDGLRFFLNELVGTFAGVQFLIGVVFCLFVGVQLMFEYR